METNQEHITNNSTDYKARRVASTTDSIRNIVGSISMGSKFQGISNLFYLIMYYFAWLIIPYLRRDFGERSFSLLMIMLSGAMIWMVQLFAGGYNTLSNFSKKWAAIDVTLYHLFWKGYVILMIIHYAHILYRAHIRKRHVQSFFHGHSWLYDLIWLPLVRKFNFRLVRSEQEFQWYIEPIILLCVALILSYLGSTFSILLIVCAICLFLFGREERANFRNKLLDLKDAEIINSILIEKAQEGEESTSSPSTSTRSSLLTNPVILGDIQQIEHAQKSLDESLIELQKRQNL